jgi:hypothetical protein
MGFPAENLLTEILISGHWVSITSDVLGRSQISIKRGRTDAFGSATAGSMNLTLKDYTTPGKYNNRNPDSPYYGLIPRNTQIRQIVQPHVTTGTASDIADAFTRSESSSWGSTPEGQAWTLTGVGGALFSDYDVNGSKATAYVSSASGYRMAYLAGLTPEDGVMTLSGIEAPLATGADLEVGVMYRGQTTTVYGHCRMHITTAGVIQVKVYRADTGAQITPTYTSTVTHTGTGQPLTMKVRFSGQLIWVKVWASAGVEPTNYQVAYLDPSVVKKGWIGVRVGRSTSNTNTTDPQFAISGFDFTYESIRFHGEVPDWRTSGDKTGNLVLTKITAAGLFRRLRGAAKPLDSPIRRFVETKRGSVTYAYWPCEDGSDATQIASAIPSIGPMTVIPTDVDMASDNSFEGSKALPVFGTTTFTSSAIRMPYTGLIAYGMLMTFPDAGLPNGAPIVDIRQSGHASGTVVRWELVYFTPGDYLLRGMNSVNATVVSIGPIGGTQLNGNAVKIAINLTQSGGNVFYEIFIIHEAPSLGFYTSGTFVGQSIGRVDDLRFNSQGQLDGAGFGHIVLSNTSTSVSQFSDAPWGHKGEAANTRFTRLCDESGFQSEFRGTTTTKMGAQRITTLWDNLQDIENVDRGILYEPRNFLGVGYRCREDLYNQQTSVSASHSALAEPLEPIDDDGPIQNSVTVNRYSGSGTTIEQNTGPLSTQVPPNGVGLYNQSYSVAAHTDPDTADIAGHLLGLGTHDELRFPGWKFDLRDYQTSTGVKLAESREGDHLNLTAPPAWLAPDTLKVLVRGITEKLANDDRERGWPMEFNVTPERPYEVVTASEADGAQNGFRTDVDERYDAAERSTLNASITTTDTTLAIASAGTVWSTNPEDYPSQATIVSGLAPTGEEITIAYPGTALTGNYSFTTLTNWSNQNSSITLSSDVYVHGTSSVLVTPDGVSSEGGVFSDRAVCVPSTSHRASAWVYTAVGLTAIRVVIDWYTLASGGAYITTTLGTVQPLTAGLWTNIQVLGTAPGTAFGAQVRVLHQGTPPSTSTYYVDVCYLQAMSSVSTTSPQTFTVERSLNGLVKAWPSGSEIFPTYPAVASY